jgi:Tfp pilus assembly protein PilN
MSTRVYQQINLYQPIFRRQRQIFSALTMAQAVGVFVTALLTIYGYGLWQVRGLEAEALQLEGREKAYSAQLARLDPSSSIERRREVERELERLNTTLIEQQKLIDVLKEQPLGSTEGFSSYLDALARQHERGLWLTEIKINGASNAIELVGHSLAAERVPAYLLKLGEEEALAGQRFDDFEIERKSDSDEVSFRVSSRAANAGRPRDRAEGR